MSCVQLDLAGPKITFSLNRKITLIHSIFTFSPAISKVKVHSRSYKIINIWFIQMFSILRPKSEVVTTMLKLTFGRRKKS